MNQGALRTERFILLAKQLRDEIGNHYGWKSNVSRLLCVSPSYLDKVMMGKVRIIGNEVVRRASDNLNLPMSWFTQAETSHFREAISQHVPNSLGVTDSQLLNRALAVLQAENKNEVHRLGVALAAELVVQLRGKA